MEMYFKRMKDEWTGLVEQADPFIRAKVILPSNSGHAAK